MLRLLLFLSFLLVAPPAWSATYYVGVTGNDSNPGTSESRFLTINKCAQTMVAGDLCLVGDGNYTTSGSTVVALTSSLVNNGQEGNPITLRSENPLGAQIVVPQALVVGSPKRGILISGVTDWVIEGFDIHDDNGAVQQHSIAAIYVEGGNRVTIRGNWIHNISRNACASNNHIYGNAGIYSTFSPQNFIVEGNVFNTIGVPRSGEGGCTTTRYQHDHAMYIASSTDWIIRRNVIYDSNRGFTIQVGGGPNVGMKVYNNTLAGKSPTGLPDGNIMLWSTMSGLDFKNNFFYVPELAPFGLYPPSGANITSTSITYNRTDVNEGATDFLTVAKPAGITSANNAGNVTPGFVNALCTQADGGCQNTDFTLTPTSALIDVGTAISGYPSNGAGLDVGAYETFTHSSATINETFLDVTLGMNLNLPVQPTSAGWSAACSGGVNCGTPVVSAAVKLTGSDNIVRLTLTGLGGSGVCEVGQTWTVSYNAATGSTTDSAKIGGTLNQELSTFTAQAVTNACGAAPPAEPGTPLIIYELNESSGTTADNTGSSGAADDGTLTGSPLPTWTTGFILGGLQFADGVDQDITVPYGSGVNPSSQSLTVAFGVYVPAGLEASTRTYFGTTLGTNQRFYISTFGGQWKIGIQSSNDSAASNLNVVSGWNRVCLVANSTTDIATLTVNGVVGTSGASKAYTSYTFPADFVLGSPFGASSTPGVIYDKFKIWTSAESCADDWAAWQPSSPPSTGTRAQVTHQFQGALLVNSAVVPMAAVGANATIAPGGYFAFERQVDCTVAACSSIGEKLYYSCALCPSAGAWTAVPDTLGPDQIAYSGPILNMLTGPVVCCLSGALTPNDGSAQSDSAAIPVYALAQNASITNTSVLRTGTPTVGWEYCFKAYNQTTLPLDSYTPSGGGCITIVNPSASGFASLPKQPTGLTVTPNPTQVGPPSAGWPVSAESNSSFPCWSAANGPKSDGPPIRFLTCHSVIQ